MTKSLKKIKWDPTAHQKSYLADLDFDPEGKRAATIDAAGACSISDVDSGDYLCHTKTSDPDEDENDEGNFNQCKWSPLSSEQLVYLHYGGQFLNIFDVEKKKFNLKKPQKLGGEDSVSTCISVCPTNANLVAISTYCDHLKIYDRRKGKIVKKMEVMEDEYSIIYVEWNPNGTLLATAIGDGSVKVIDFKSGKIIGGGTVGQTADVNCV